MTQPQKINSWQEYFIAKESVRRGNIQYRAGKLSNNDLIEHDILTLRVKLFEDDNNIKNEDR